MKCIKDLEAWLKQEHGAADLAIEYEETPSDMEGDITVNCFRFAKALKANPMELAGKVRGYLESHPDVESVACVKAFVNTILKSAALYRDTVAATDALLASVALPADQRRRIVIEYSAPNTNKPLHLGHVRNNTIGAALVALLRAVGHAVVPVNLVNDRGIHICKSMIAYERWGRGSDPANAGMKGDHFVGGFYVRYNEELLSQLAALRASDPSLAKESDDALFGRTAIGAETQEMLQKWEAGDQAVRALWKRMNAWVLDGFDATYRRMGVAFEKVYLESDTYTEGKRIVEQGLDDGVFARRDDGAVEADLESVKLGRKVLLRSDGTSVYITQDIGTTLLKHADYGPDEQVWVVGDEQINHFKVLFALIRKLGHAWADGLVHLAYGMVDLPTGKMKSREGTVVDADALLDEMEALARAACLERRDDGAGPPADLERRAQVIGQGALKYWLLRFNARSRILFDPAASIRFEGDTGPYVQYACARIHSILARAADDAGEDEEEGEIRWERLDSAEERELTLRCAAYPRKLQKAAAALDPSIVAEAVLGLAKDFSRFYRACPVIQAGDADLRSARLALCRRVLAVIEHGLQTLTIDSLESM